MAVDNNDKYKPDMADMSLRDWFAGQALIGLLSNYGLDSGEDYNPRDGYNFEKTAYVIADAMLTQREKEVS